MQTEVDFELPRGYLTEDGTLHRKGRMRLATARDELRSLRDLRVRDDPAYLGIVLLSLVVTSLGDLQDLEAEDIERLFAADLAHLQHLYHELNGTAAPVCVTTCGSCGARVEVPVGGGRLGES
ncbi:hypothetical protein ACFY12_08435 [Streptomyces sp. NPDC001339]|uniref:hypothetical protein n=1 Tax=Streptomyces sp. NPDC001339 TaxID=3364563 RepID=UPI0036B82EFC